MAGGMTYGRARAHGFPYRAAAVIKL